MIIFHISALIWSFCLMSLKNQNIINLKLFFFVCILFSAMRQMVTLPHKIFYKLCSFSLLPIALYFSNFWVFILHVSHLEILQRCSITWRTQIYCYLVLGTQNKLVLLLTNVVNMSSKWRRKNIKQEMHLFYPSESEIWFLHVI